MSRTLPQEGMSLSPREMAVLEVLVEGNSNNQIARRLGISYQTVRNHVGSIMKKLGAQDRTHAVVLAFRQGLIPLDETNQGPDRVKQTLKLLFGLKDNELRKIADCFRAKVGPKKIRGEIKSLLRED